MSTMQSARNNDRSARAPVVRYAVMVALIIVALLLVVKFVGGASKPAAAAEKPAAAPLELAAADVGSVERRALSRSLPLSGSLSPLVQTTVKSKVAGEVLEMTVREGQAVRRGEVLARIDLKNLKAQYDSQAASLEKARADLSIAKTNLDNNKAMLEQHFISKNAFDSASSTYEAAAASVRAAEAQARLAQIGLDDAVVRAPIDGVISKRMAQPGEKISPDSPLFAIVDLTRLELEALAPASEIPAVKIGQRAQFHVNGFGDRVFEGRVERINPTTEEGSRSIKLYLSVANTDGALRGGMFGQGELVLDKTEPAPAIPLTAVRTEAGATYVLSVEDGKLVQRAVTLGLSTADNSLVEVRDGLREGEQIVVAKIDTLKPGTAVIIKADPATAGDAAR